MSRWPRRTLRERFWSKVDKNGPTMPHMKTQCWVWKAATKKGYGVFQIGTSTKSRTITAHRQGYQLQFGKVPKGLHVLHECDNRPCVRHLRAGTQLENNKEAAARGRMKRGERHYTAVLTTEQVIEIRRAYANDDISMARLALQHQVSQGTIHCVVARKTWKHVA